MHLATQQFVYLATELPRLGGGALGAGLTLQVDRALSAPGATS